MLDKTISASKIERIANVAMLYDFYGPLLTEKQSRIIEMYFMNDLSLSEIGAELGISRQAAGILISRTVRILEKYEGKLGLVRKHIETAKKAEKSIGELKALIENGGLCDGAKDAIMQIISGLSEEYRRGI